MLFRNFYRCARCGREWTDVWPAQCDDDCPHCGARIPINTDHGYQPGSSPSKLCFPPWHVHDSLPRKGF
jgi:DNA-directed RNA polymerase subunit RPC12/RpoP